LRIATRRGTLSSRWGIRAKTSPSACCAGSRRGHPSRGSTRPRAPASPCSRHDRRPPQCRREHCDEDAAIDALRRTSQFNVLDLDSGWKFDLLIRKARALGVRGLWGRVQGG
jgi:hypothetical protein